MEFVGYADRAAALLNARLETLDDVRDFLLDREGLSEKVGERDGQLLRRFQRELGPVFSHAVENEDGEAVRCLNTLLSKYPLRTHIDGDESGTWRMKASREAPQVADLLVAEALMGLAYLTCGVGLDRIGRCGAEGCAEAFVDISPNRSRRYCSDRCSSRANVAAFRARRRTARATYPAGSRA